MVSKTQFFFYFELLTDLVVTEHKLSQKGRRRTAY